MLKAAKDIEYILESMRRSKVGVFIAAAAPDVREERRSLLRELSVSDFDVRPNFSLSAAVDDDTLRTTVDGAQLAIFTLGAAYDGFVQKQLDQCRERGVPITYWIDTRKGDPAPNQAKLIATLRDQGHAVLNGPSVRQVAEQVIGRLRFKSDTPLATDGPKKVFLLYDTTTPADGDFANRTLGQMIRDQGLTVFTPDVKLISADRLQDRDRFLEKFDGVLLYRDQAPEGWLWPNVMELSVAATAKGCVLGPTQADLFSRYVPVIPHGTDFGPEKLAPFFAQLQEARR